MKAQVVKWGNGQGLRIPKSILLALDISVGDHVDLSVSQGKLIVQKPFRHKSLEERAAESGGKLVSFETEIDWGEPVGQEVW